VWGVLVRQAGANLVGVLEKIILVLYEVYEEF